MTGLHGDWVSNNLATCCLPRFQGCPQQMTNKLRIKSSHTWYIIHVMSKHDLVIKGIHVQPWPIFNGLVTLVKFWCFGQYLNTVSATSVIADTYLHHFLTCSHPYLTLTYISWSRKFCCLGHFINNHQCYYYDSWYCMNQEHGDTPQSFYNNIAVVQSRNHVS